MLRAINLGDGRTAAAHHEQARHLSAESRSGWLAQLVDTYAIPMHGLPDLPHALDALRNVVRHGWLNNAGPWIGAVAHALVEAHQPQTAAVVYGHLSAGANRLWLDVIPQLHGLEARVRAASPNDLYEAAAAKGRTMALADLMIYVRDTDQTEARGAGDR